MKASFLVNSLFILLFLSTYTKSQYIASTYSYDYALTYIFQDLQNALGDPFLKQLQALAFEDIAEGAVSIKRIKPTLTSSTVEDSYGDIKSNFYIISPDKVSILFDFSYTTQEAQSKQAELELSLFDTRIKLKTNEESTSPLIEAEIEVRKQGFAIYGAGTDQQSLQDIIFKHSAPLITKIKEGLIKAVEDHFKANNKKKPFRLELTSLLKKIVIEVNLNLFTGFCEVHDANDELIICFYSGNPLETVNMKLRQEALEYKDFLKPSKYKKLFLNYKIFSDAIQKMIQDKEPIMHLSDQSPIAKELPYKFTILELKKVINDAILTPFKDTLPFTVTNSVLDLDFTQAKKGLKIKSSIIINRYDRIIIFETTFEFEMSYIKDKSSPEFNACISEIKDPITVTMITPNALKDAALLTIWVSKTLRTFSPNDICLGNKFINLRDYFKGEIKNFVVEKNGFYLEGESLY